MLFLFQFQNQCFKLLLFKVFAQKVGKWSWNVDSVITTREDQNTQEELDNCED